jgi:hypothetical protein
MEKNHITMPFYEISYFPHSTYTMLISELSVLSLRFLEPLTSNDPFTS